MQYFTDGLDGLIRVHSDEHRGSKEFFFAMAEKLGVDGSWYRRHDHIIEVLHSGYYRPATAEEVRGFLAWIDPYPPGNSADLIDDDITVEAALRQPRPRNRLFTMCTRKCDHG